MVKIQQQKTKQVLSKKGTGSSQPTPRKVIKLAPGVRLAVKITAIGPNNVGINEFSYGMPILVPNAKLGDVVQVQILKLYTKYNVAIAKLVKTLTKTNTKLASNQTRKVSKPTVAVDLSKLASTPVLSPGDVLEVSIKKLGTNNTAIIELPNAYQNVNKVIVAPSINTSDNSLCLPKVGKVSITITRIKSNYALAVINTTEDTGISTNKTVESLNQTLTNFKGTKFTLVIPASKVSLTKKSLKKGGFKYIGFKLSNKNAAVLPANTILFLKPSLGAKSGDKVQIQITKFVQASNGTKSNIAIAKIVRLNPISAKQKKALVFSSLRQMLKSGMHYGEKAIKCNARMKNYVWLRKKGQNTNKPLLKKGRNVINLLKTRRCLNKALAQLSKYAAKGKTFLFVGTKKAAAGLVSRASLFSKKAFFVNTRWLGGMLTNWKTIVKSISKIRPILKEKQIIIKDILLKRQNIKARLIQKALLLRKKSKLMLKKGRQLIQFIKTNATKDGSSTSKSTNLYGLETINLLNAKRKELISKGIVALEKRQQLLLKRQELILQSQSLKSKALQLTTSYRQLLTNLLIARKKLRELKSLLLISKELQGFKQQAKEKNQKVYMVSYNKFRTLNETSRVDSITPDSIISNPPREILNKMVSIIKGQGLALTADLSLKSTGTKAPHLYISQLLSKFTLFVPTIKTSIKNLQQYTTKLQTGLNKVLNLLTTVKTKMMAFVNLKAKIVAELREIKQTLQTERNIIRILKRKLKQISAQKRLIKFLPKLRYLPTPTQKIEQTARFLMKKFVDPKMKYSMDTIYDDKLSRQSKKVAASRKKKWQRLERYLGGISNMTKLKDKNTNQFMRNNVAIILGQQEEMNAVRECQKLGIKMFHIVDTNCNPGFADHFIPANDDARNSIKFILAKFLTRIRLAHKLKTKFKKKTIKISNL